MNYRLNPRYAIKECSSCGALYTRDCCCSKGNVEDKILVPKPPKNCARCAHPVDGPYCQGCALLRKKLEEDLGTHFQDFQNTSESSDDSTNVVNAPREPFDAFGNKQYKPEDIQELFRKLLKGLQNIHEELAEYINSPSWNRPAFYDDDADDDVDYTIAITPVLSTNEADNSLKISSGSTTTHSDISLSEYDSFIFDLSNDQFRPTNRSHFTHEEFANELAHIISPSEYDCFYFKDLPDSGEWISSLNSEIREKLSSTTYVNLPVEDDHSPLLTYVVWIFLAYLTYPVIPLYRHLFGNENTIFDPGIAINRFYSFKPGLSHRCGTFEKFNTHRSHLNERPMEMLFSTCFPMDQ
nr:hypothetical protein [Tanacetum cinerariifolium]